MSDELITHDPSEDAKGEKLVQRARHDRDAFAELYDRYYPRVAKYCLRRIFNRTIAEDILSEVFLQVASHIGTFPGKSETDFRRWLFRIATNCINAYLRQTLRRNELMEDVARYRSVALGDRTEKEILSPEWADLFQSLLELEERDRTIVSLRFFAEFSYADIANVIDSTPGAVRTALSRILSRLREQFDTESMS